MHDNESNCSLPETFSKIVQSALSEKMPGSHLLRYFVWKKVLKKPMFYKQQYVHIYLYFTSTNICTKISLRVKTYCANKKDWNSDNNAFLRTLAEIIYSANNLIAYVLIIIYIVYCRHCSVYTV